METVWFRGWGNAQQLLPTKKKEGKNRQNMGNLDDATLTERRR
jgi:hypothetical protein